jgi:hypothetical protein
MSMEDRLAKIERESRTWRRIALVLALLIGASLSCTQSNQGPPASPSTPAASAQVSQADGILEVVRTRELQIVNDAGETVAGVEGTAKGGRLYVYADDGDIKSQLVVEAAPNKIRLIIRDRDSIVSLGTEDITVSAFEGDPLIIAKLRAGQLLTEDEAAKVKEQLFRAPAVKIACTHDRSGIIEVANPAGKVAASIQCDKDDQGGRVNVNDVAGELGNSLAPQ